jgi:hypothetical protein
MSLLLALQTVIGPMSGTTSLSLDTSGVLSATAGLSGATSITLDASGSISAVAGLSGATSITLDASGVLSVLGSMSGSTSISFSVTGDLTDGQGSSPYVPFDTALPPNIVGIYIGQGGDVNISMRPVNINGAGYVSLIYKNIPSGSILPVQPQMILSSGTTADYITSMLRM